MPTQHDHRRTPSRGGSSRGEVTACSARRTKYAVAAGIVFSLALCLFLRSAGLPGALSSAPPVFIAGSDGGEQGSAVLAEDSGGSGGGSGGGGDDAGPEQEGERSEREHPAAVVVPRNASDVRSYLNGLVAASAGDADNQRSNLAMFKTHKTGSTTLALLLHRYGKRHGLKVAHFPGYGSTIPIAVAAEKVRSSGQPVDIMHYHIDTDTPQQERWWVAREQYRGVMRDPEDINFITLLREPRDRLLSFYTFFVEFETRVPIEEFLRQERPDPEVLGKLRNLGCKEFGLDTEEDLQDFIEHDVPQFKLILLTERFEEGLMVLRRLLGWHLIDMTFISVNRSAGRQSKNGVLPERSPFEKLPGDIQEKIDDLTVLDRQLYDAGVVAFEKSRAAVADEVDTDLVEFERLQEVMNEYLKRNPKSPVLAMYRYKTAVYYEVPPPMLEF
ncbi:unnamed protein product [Scytosiphon promiscuus]